MKIYTFNKRRKKSMATYLLAWNPKKWDWDKIAIHTLEEMSAEVKKGVMVRSNWSIANLHAREGDRVFIIKVGKGTRGIFASGIITSMPFEALSYDAEKASKGIKTHFIQFEYDTLLNPEADEIIDWKSLKEEPFSKFNWGIQTSGVFLSEEMASCLEKRWAELKKKPKSRRDEIWSKEELIATVDAYLSMLDDEIHGRLFNKAAINRTLIEGPLSSRTIGAIEYRFSNISSILIDLGLPFVKGYLPASHVGERNTKIILQLLAERVVIPTSSYPPTDDEKELEEDVEILRKKKFVKKPEGQQNPERSSKNSQGFKRDPNVIAWVLENANGICEGCGQKASFQNSYGIPYLEAHHVRWLANKGPDTVENAVALCPNCHSRCHHSEDKDAFATIIYVRNQRLIR
jgi:5-methylcytosine-specific restriction enzyme A